MNDLKLYAHALLDNLKNKPTNYIELEDKLENEGFAFEIDVIKNMMYFVNDHEQLDVMLAGGI